MPLAFARSHDPPVGARTPKMSTRDSPPPGGWALRERHHGAMPHGHEYASCFVADMPEHNRGTVVHERHDCTQLKTGGPSMPVCAEPRDNLLAVPVAPVSAAASDQATYPTPAPHGFPDAAPQALPAASVPDCGTCSSRAGDSAPAPPE